MFGAYVSCISVLQLVAQRCSLPYVSFIREIDGDGACVYSIELDLPLLFAGEVPHRFFFWSATSVEPFSPYEDAVLRTLQFLQAIYGFHIVDYNYAELCLYRRLAPQLFGLANRGVHLARYIVNASAYGPSYDLQLLSAAHELLEHIGSVIGPQ